MRITKIDDQTMECVLASEDMANRGISLEELSYTSPVMRSLVHDLAIFLAKKYSFGTKESPAVVVDAIPLSDGSLDLVFSTDAYTDDLDPRYSNFSDRTEVESADTSDNNSVSGDEIPSTIGDILKSIFEAVASNGQADKYLLRHDSTDEGDSWSEAIYEFDSLDDVTRAISMLDSHLDISVGIYRSRSGIYLVPVHYYNLSDDTIIKISDVFCEFGYPKEISIGTDLYIAEHCEKLASVMTLIVLKLLLTPRT